MLFALNSCEVAVPVASVTAVVMPDSKAPLAPEAGAVKVTVTPAIGLLRVSFTRTESGDEKVAVAYPDCGVPAVATMDVGTWRFERENVAGVPTAAVDANTL